MQKASPSIKSMGSLGDLDARLKVVFSDVRFVECDEWTCANHIVLFEFSLSEIWYVDFNTFCSFELASVDRLTEVGRDVTHIVWAPQLE